MQNPLRFGWTLFLTLIVSLTLTGVAGAEDAYYRVLLKDLKLTEGHLTEPKVEDAYRGYSRLEPTILLDGLEPGAGEVYFLSPGQMSTAWDWVHPREGISVLLRGPAGKDLTGRLYAPAEDWRSLVELHFTVPATTADAKARDGFLDAKARHYEELLNRNIPGAAWFRHQADQARDAQGKDKKNDTRLQFRQNRGEVEETYELFSGGRAVSENLQLDRVLLPRAGSTDETVAIDSLKGITVSELDWKPLIAGKTPATDPMAAMVPIDQHAIFFPSFAAMTGLMDEADAQGTPILQYAEPRSEDARTKSKYQKQLCIPLTGLGRLLGPKLINGLCLTGSDPYLRVGSDIAILFEPKDLASLQGLLGTQMNLAATTSGTDAARVTGKTGNVEYTGFVSSNRQVCAYLATVGQTVVVTNSLAQLQRLVDVQAGNLAAVSSAPEYTFFRDRYQRGQDDEGGFIVLTDATIRRWCSARWRIGDSRRTRAAAVMAELQAQSITDLVAGKVEAGKIHTEHNYEGLGELRLTAQGVTSSVYGSLDFMTPIVELKLEKVTAAEADAYTRWRDSYQQNWRNYFDPIAVRLSATPKTLGLDMTVMPLIANSDYRTMIAISKGAKIDADSGDPHDALIHMAIAFNAQSETVQGFGKQVSQFVPQLKIDPFSWIGQTISFYVDDDPIWAEAAKAENPDKFFQEHMDRLPLALYVKSANVFKLTAFLTAVHAFVDQSAPGLVSWETQTYNDVQYVKVAPTAKAKADTKELDNAAIFYSTAGGALLITPSEALLKRSIDRQAARAAADPAKKDAAVASPWLGENYCIQVGGANLIKLISAWTSSSATMQLESWSNLPILNEWKRRFPDQDPVALHERFWQTRLLDPAGGTYVWNEKFQTMESTIYGCPQSPKTGPILPSALESLEKANLGVTFEKEGLRAKVQLRRKNYNQ